MAGPTIYLSGRFTGTFGEVRAARDKVIKLLLDRNLRYFDPARGFGSGKLVGKITIGAMGQTMKERVESDLYQLHHSDVVLVLTGDTPSWGTAFEAAHAVFVQHIPVVVVGTTVGSWLEHYAAKVCPTVEEAVDYIAAHFTQPFEGPNYRRWDDWPVVMGVAPVGPNDPLDMTAWRWAQARALTARTAQEKVR